MKKSVMSKILSIVLVLFIAGLNMLVACGNEATVPVEATEVPTATSEDLDLFIDAASVVHRDGSKAEGYSLDADGNVINSDQKPVIVKEKTSPFTCISEVKYDESATKGKLLTYTIENEKPAVAPVKLEIELTFNPTDAVNTGVELESNDPGALYVPYDANAELLKDMEKPTANALAAVTLAETQNPVKLTVIGCFEGKYTLTVRNAKDEEISKITFTFEAEKPVDEKKTEADEEKKNPESTDLSNRNAGPHEHTYYDTVVDPTYRTRGYTLHICSICGYTFRDNYTNQLVCTHDYETHVVEPTYTEGGYTEYVCKYCGDSKRGNPTPVKACSHDWDSGVTKEQPTCVKEGTRSYKCTICGQYKTETIPRTAHSMTSEVILPTYDSEGYTRHYCSVCGYETAHTDITPRLVHEHNYISAMTEPTCTGAGYTTYTCTSCGNSYTDNSVPALGHNYTEQVVPPTCEQGGYTVHTCSRCGASYTDNETAALGHAWEEHTSSQVVGQEQHQICKDCGADLTAMGLSNDGAWAHVEAHLLNDENALGGYYSAMVDIYDTVTTYTCRRCGATK